MYGWSGHGEGLPVVTSARGIPSPAMKLVGEALVAGRAECTRLASPGGVPSEASLR